MHTAFQRYRTPTVLAAGGLAAMTIAFAIGDRAVAAARRTTAKPRPATVTGRIRLDRRTISPGATIRGELVFDNHTSSTRVLLRGCRVDGLYGIGLRPVHGPLQGPVFASVACHPEQALLARPGVTVDRFALPARSMHCVQSPAHQPPAGSRGWAPLCRRGPGGARDIAPALPAGSYWLEFVPDGIWRGPRVGSAELTIH